MSVIFDTRVTHVRTDPVRNSFTYRSRWWLVDVDDLPSLPRLLRPLARFLSRDHLGDPALSLRENVAAHLAGHGVVLDEEERVLLLTLPRSLGHAFNPLSIFWCFGGDGSLLATLAEVHNTYGGRHVYTLFPEGDVPQEVCKELYVSPFHPVDGSYALRLPFPGRAPGAELSLSVRLDRPGSRPFVASVRGVAVPVSPRSVLTGPFLFPMESLRVVFLIHYQGVKLFLRGLRVQERPPGDEVPHDTPSSTRVSSSSSSAVRSTVSSTVGPS